MRMKKRKRRTVTAAFGFLYRPSAEKQHYFSTIIFSILSSSWLFCRNLKEERGRRKRGGKRKERSVFMRRRINISIIDALCGRVRARARCVRAARANALLRRAAQRVGRHRTSAQTSSVCTRQKAAWCALRGRRKPEEGARLLFGVALRRRAMTKAATRRCFAACAWAIIRWARGRRRRGRDGGGRRTRGISRDEGVHSRLQHLLSGKNGAVVLALLAGGGQRRHGARHKRNFRRRRVIWSAIVVSRR